MQESGWTRGLVLLNLSHNLHLLTRGDRKIFHTLLEASCALAELALDINHIFLVLPFGSVQNHTGDSVLKPRFMYKIHVIDTICFRHSNEVVLFILACSIF